MTCICRKEEAEFAWTFLGVPTRHLGSNCVGLYLEVALTRPGITPAFKVDLITSEQKGGQS